MVRYLHKVAVLVVIESTFALLVGIGAFVLSVAVIQALVPPVPVIVLCIVDVAVVLAVSNTWGIVYAVPVAVSSVVALDWYLIMPTHSFTFPGTGNLAALSAYLLTGVMLGQLAAHARRRAEVAERDRAALADEQAALRRVATLVAHERSPAEVFAAATEEVRSLLETEATGIVRYEPDGTATVVARHGGSGIVMPIGARLPVEGENVAATGLLASYLREQGAVSSASSRIVVRDRLWGVMLAISAHPGSLPSGTQERMGEFTELVATAIANADTRAELTASRARIVATGDEVRRRLERDLHDGAQQRLVSMALEVRVARASAPPAQQDLQELLSRVEDGLTEVLDDLREISHGIHPQILSDGGLRPALKALARRSAVPVELDVRHEGRLPEQVEVGAYYVVSEALTNAAKHARATVVRVQVEVEDDEVRLAIHDDGIGGADLARGSGLVGLKDRVETLGGRIDLSSPAGGGGTLLRVHLPI